MLASSRKTPKCSFMVVPMSSLICPKDSFFSLSRRLCIFFLSGSDEESSKSMKSTVFAVSEACIPDLLPNTRVSSSELAPSRFPP